MTAPVEPEVEEPVVPEVPVPVPVLVVGVSVVEAEGVPVVMPAAGVVVVEPAPGVAVVEPADDEPLEVALPPVELLLGFTSK